nr:xanthine dehydrogenase family protein molybdopterin-binding subunit [Pseudonocardia acidicola]
MKVTGAARYAAEHPLPGLAHGAAATATIARGRIIALDTAAVLAMPGVIAVLHHGSAPRLVDAGQGDLMLFQDDRVPYRGAAVALVVAQTPEQARAGADVLRVEYAEEPHDVVLTADHPRLYAPDHVNPTYPTDTATGDVEAGLTAAAVVVDATYSTPTEQNSPMEPHSSTAWWTDGRLTVIDSNQGSSLVRDTLATLFALDPDAVRVVSEHVGGAFGVKGRPWPPVVLAPMAARQLNRPVRVTLTRQQMFALVGYRTPTIQRVRLGADRDGRLIALDHLACEQTSTVVEFAEQTCVPSRVMYATPNLRTRHRLVALDVPSPHWMRAPGEAPGSFALESAMDELAQACGIDPVELRVRNEPTVEPAGGLPFVSRNLVRCLHEGAARFGWSERDPRPGIRRDGRWLRGTGMAAANYPARSRPSTASATAEPDGRYTVRITASDLGTGARTALTQIAADELGTPLEQVRVLIGDSDFGAAQIAGGSMGTASWGWAVVKAVRELRDRLAGSAVPADGLTVRADTTSDIEALPAVSRHAFGAHFAEVVVDPASGEVRVPRLLGVYGVGRVVNPITARSQLIGGMTMGLGMALLEEAVVDPQFGDYANHDLAGYHVPANADVRSIEAHWIDEEDDGLNPTGVKGVGEIGIVGTAAAIANAVWHATGVRHRDLPIRPGR